QPDGRVWAGWNRHYCYLPSGEPNARAGGLTLLGIQPDGRLLAAEGPLRRYTGDGLPDPSFNASWTPHVPDDSALAFQPDGKIIVACEGSVVRLEASGALDTSFARVSAQGVVDISLHPGSGKIYLGGDLRQVNGV